MLEGMTPTTESPTSDVALPESTARNLVDFLLDDGEQKAIEDAVAMEIDEIEVLGDLVSGWGCSVSLPRPHPKRPNNIGRGKKGSKAFPPDIDTTNIRIRCVSDDYNGDHHKSSWKANVEPGTYRYINNNGIYRSSKFASVGNDWVTVKRSRQSDAMTTTPELKQVQKNLKRDLSQIFRPTDTAKSEPNRIRRENATPNGDGSQTNGFNAKSSSATGIGGLIDHRTSKDIFKDPKLVKSTSDLFVEKFSTRMDALQKSEKEMQGTTPSSESKSGMNQRTSTRSSKRLDQQGYDTGQEEAEDIAKDVFTVKPVTRLAADQPLRPLEKLTPQQRNMDRGSESECSSHQSRSEPESPVLPTSFMNAMNAFARLHHQQLRGGKDAKSKSGPSTYRGHHKNSIGNASATSHLSDTDSLHSVRNALTMTNSSIERMRMRPYAREFATKDYNVKDYGKFLSGVKYQPGMSTSSTSKATITGKPPHANAKRKGIVGYRPTIPHSQTQQQTHVAGPVVTAATSSVPSQPTHHHQAVSIPPSIEDVRSNISDSSESYLSGTSLAVHRGSGNIREAKTGSMALPEISGKRLPVTISSQRLL